MAKIMWASMPIQKAKGGCYFRVNGPASRQGFFSMEVGNYNRATNTAGLGSMSSFAARDDSSHTNSGTFNQIIDTTTMLAGQKKILYPQEMRVTMRNNTNFPQTLKIYWVKSRRDEDVPGNLTFEDRWENAIAADFAPSPLMVPNLSPFDSRTFVNQNKILKTKTIHLAAGDQTSLFVKSPVSGTVSKEAMTDSQMFSRWTRGILVFFRGPMVGDTTDPLKVENTFSYLHVEASTTCKWRNVNTNAMGSAVTFFDNGDISNTNSEFGPGPENKISRPQLNFSTSA